MLTATPEAERSRRAGVAAAATRPVSAASVAAFRMGVGLLLAFSSVRFLARGWVDSLYLAPQHHLTYRWFGWVEPLPSLWMHALMVALAALGVAIAAGYRTRVAALLFLVGFAYTELIDAALYLNHYWFVTLVVALIALLPLDGLWSVDGRVGRVAITGVVPAWVVWVLRSQIAVVYLFAGLAKLNADWLFRAQPMDLWLDDRTAVPLVGWVLGLDGMAFVMSWAGAVFDCTIVGFLLWRRSRPVAYATLVVFHAMTGALFQIGVFPIVMIVVSLIFFGPDWPRALACRFSTAASAGAGADAVSAEPSAPPLVGCRRFGRARTVALILFAGLQLWLPLRHLATDSNVRWSEEGYYLSWRVMLTEKAGFVEYEVIDPSTGERWLVDASLVLEDWQRSVAATRPDLIHATALLIADHYRGEGVGGLEVRADAWVAMNGRPAARIVDPTIDLAAHKRGELPASWIFPDPLGDS